MAHLASKDLYARLGRKIDSLTTRAPQNDTFQAILRELYSPEEAELVVKMPFALADFAEIQRITGFEPHRLRELLQGLAEKGLAVDFYLNDDWQYAASPFVIGIFELTMMRAGNRLDLKKMARRFHDYWQGQGEGSFFKANYRAGDQVALLRTLPHEGTVLPSQYVEVLDYEKATAIVKEVKRFSIGICSCRHEKHHIGEKRCNVPLETCTSFDYAAEYLIRHQFAREVSQAEVLDTLARSKEMGLVFNADNVQKNITFICQCCKCCCNALLGISQFGYPQAIVTSNFLAQSDSASCLGCGKCARKCPIAAIEMVNQKNPGSPKKPRVDTTVCLGCGVCALFCRQKAMQLERRPQRVLHPETTFERVVLHCLERGTLQYQILTNPQSKTQGFLRALLGAFLNLSPVKKTLMSNLLRSTFLELLKKGSSQLGKGWVTKV